MKCPKCSYISFDGADRCRNCGYDFALAPEAAGVELPLRDRHAAGSPIADLPLEERGTSSDARLGATGHRTPGAEVPTGGAPLDLPLFDEPVPGVDDTPLITAAAPPRPPLAVRRATPDTPRPRSADAVPPERKRQASPRSGPLLGPASEGIADAERAADHSPGQRAAVASTGPRVGAALFDAALILAIDAVVLYFTLRLTGLTLSQATELPLIPLLGYFAVLNGGYLVGFTTASGQTPGKMLTGVRVVGELTTRVPLGNAIVRALSIALTIASLGVGYIPVLTGRDRRALHDRLAGTKVVPC